MIIKKISIKIISIKIINETLHKINRKQFYIFILILLCPLYAFDIFYLSFKENKSSLEVIMIPSHSTLYKTYNGKPAGLEYDLIKNFAIKNNLKIKFKLVQNYNDLLIELQSGTQKIAASKLPSFFENKNFLKGPAYKAINYNLICHKNVNLKNLSEIKNTNIEVIQHSPEEKILQNLVKKHSNIFWYSINKNTKVEKILQRINNKKIDCTILDSLNFKYYKRIYLNARIKIKDLKKSKLVWYLNKKDHNLNLLVNKWHQDNIKRQNKLIARIFERYLGHFYKINIYDIKTFLKKSENVLPQYKKIFYKVSKIYNMPWQLIAAISYQESQWDPDAVSFTGVRGMMMLTKNTAKLLGISNRRDPKQSIYGGAKYLNYLLKIIPKDVPPVERLWMALAAYNVGIGHIHDARYLAKKLDKKPEFWHDLKQVLPLLTEEKHYRHLRYGYARGYEPVDYVDRIRNYFEILQKKYPN